MANKFVTWLENLRDSRRRKLDGRIQGAIEPLRTELYSYKMSTHNDLMDIRKQITELDKSLKSATKMCIENEEIISKSTQIKYHEMEANINNLRVDLENMVKEATKPKKRTTKPKTEEVPTP